MTKRKNSYSSRNPYDIDMILDEPSLLNKKGLKKRRSRKRRGLM